MKAMVLQRIGEGLVLSDIPRPEPHDDEVLIRVSACGICRTDLHLVDGDLPRPSLPLVPGHQVVGTIESVGDRVTDLSIGSRVGVPWLGWTCGKCRFCNAGRENLCVKARFTGYQIDGGYAEYCLADPRYAFPVPEGYPDRQAAPLLCAGLIGYRAFRMVGDARRIGFYGFGQAAHILIQVARHEGREVYAFTRPGDTDGQAFATQLGATWAGGSDAQPPQPLDAAVIFAPVGTLVPLALEAVDRGGVVVCAGIHMSDIPAFPYRLLWEERSLQSVANLTRRDAEDFLRLAPCIPVKTHVTTYRLEEANRALGDLREGRLQGAGVLVLA